MTITIREFDGSDADYQIMCDIWNAVWPEQPLTATTLKRNDETRKAKYAFHRLIAYQDEHPVATAVITHIDYMYDPQRFRIGINVPPQYRQQGVGKAMYDYVIDFATRTYNAKELLTYTTEDRAESTRFLETRGFTETQRAWESHLDVAAFDATPFNRATEKVTTQGIQVKTYTQLATEDANYLQKLYELDQTLDADVPSPFEYTPRPYDEWYKYNNPEWPDFIGDGYFVAVDGDDYIGMSTLWRNADEPDRLMTGLTGVRRTYRRRGVAMAMKLRALAHAKQLGKKTLVTWNEQNNPMYLINVTLGFVAQPAVIDYKLTLGEAP